MNWSRWRLIPWIDTRAAFVSATPKNGTLLDLGCSDGATLCHMSELRPDLRFSAVDLAERPTRLPKETVFAQADLESDTLPWKDGAFTAITCMHVVEHLRTHDNFWTEVARLLAPEGRVYIETPGPESVTVPSAPAALKGKITLNFYDDPTHVRPVSIQSMKVAARQAGLHLSKTGRSRNWIFTLAYPLLALITKSRQRYVAKLHWTGWSVYLIAEKRAP